MSALRKTGTCYPSHRAIILGSLLALASISLEHAVAQKLQADPEKTTISGTVTNVITHAPIARALVSSNDNRYAMLTDGSGHFEFDLAIENAAAPSRVGGRLTGITNPDDRRVWLTARKPGFLGEGENGAAAIPGEEVTISLTPESLIVGHVTLSNSEAPTGLVVELFSRQVRDGLPRWIPQHSAQSNSAGEFRFADLPAGPYKLITHELLDND